jgi:hypothetical protein
MNSKWRFLIFFFLCCSAILAEFHGYTINLGELLDKRTFRHNVIIDSRGYAPWGYRIFHAYIIEWITNLFLNASHEHYAVFRENVYIFFRGTEMFFTFVGFQLLMEKWLSPYKAFCATILFIGLHAPSFVHYWYQPSSPLDLCLWIWAIYLTLEGRFLWLIPMVFIGTINRETTCFIILFHFALQYKKEQLRYLIGRCISLSCIWLGVFIMLRSQIPVRGVTENTELTTLLYKNLFYAPWVIYALSFVGGWILYPLLHFRKWPKDLQRIAYVFIPYMILIVCFGRIREVRLLLPLCIPFIPAFFLTISHILQETHGDNKEAIEI